MADVIERDLQVLLHTYRRLPIEMSTGEGVYLFDAADQRYLDFFAGLAVNALGYRHPRIEEAILSQLHRYTHLSNIFAQEPQIELAERLLRATGQSRVFFCNSGTEATEAAIKLSRLWGASSGKQVLVGFDGGFHGRTMGALSLMSQEKYRHGYEPFLDHCCTLPYNDVAALETAIDENTCAVFLEFIQGEGGIRPVSDEFFRSLSALRERYGFLIIADEIQAGIGRTGAMFSYQHWSATPDVVLVAKSLGGGLPLGALLVNDALTSTFTPGKHGSTFGGNPVACAAGIALLDTLEEEKIIPRVREMGNYLLQRLAALKDRFHDAILEVRGLGYMIGIEFRFDVEPLMYACLERGLLVNVTQGNVVRLLPPLLIQRNHIDDAMDILTEVLNNGDFDENRMREAVTIW